MKKTIIIAALAVATAVASGETIQIRLSDDSAVPLAGAEVRVIFAGTLTDGSRDDVVRFTTDERGYGRASGRAEFRTTVFVTKPGYYDLRVERVRAGIDHDLALIMRPQRSPIPLYARRIGQADAINAKFPKHGEWVGFDLEKADWMAPHGAGKTADILFRFRHEFKGWRHSEAEMVNIRHVNRYQTEETVRRFYGK